MCCESTFTEKLNIYDAFVAALFYDYNGDFAQTFDGHERFISQTFGSGPDVDPVKMLRDFLNTKLKQFSNEMFVRMSVYRASFESLEYLLHADNGKTLLIEWLPFNGPVRARWLQ